MSDEWKSIKVKEDVYRQLKEMGIGISKAIEILIEEKRKEIEDKFRSIEDITKSIFKEMMRSGFFNISIKGFSILDAHEEGDDIIISGIVAVNVPNSEVRNRIINILKPKGE